MKHTQSLRYSRRERLVYLITGRWPQSVVDRRLDALRRDEIEQRNKLLWERR